MENDDGGHLIGSQFNGSGKFDNLVPMNAEINRAGGKWYQLEEKWKAAKIAGEKVSVKIEPVYSGTSQRPIRFEIQYKVGDGKWTKTTILNQIGG